MKEPSPVGTLISLARKQRWHERFSCYRYAPTPGAIEAWVEQFGKEHQDVAARMLDSVHVVTRPEIEQAFRSLMASIPRWHRAKNKRKGKWRFVPYSFSSGESGDQMIAYFRQAMGMKERYYDELFVHPRDLIDQRLTSKDTVVLVDDFAGSGTQACKSWTNLFRELVGGAGTVYLMVVAATSEAQRVIRDNTDLQAMTHYDLLTADNFFSEDCVHFSAAEKAAVLGYCNKHFPQMPKGYGDCGLLFVLQHDCPNNTIPLLHRYRKDQWVPLFPRSTPSI